MHFPIHNSRPPLGFTLTIAPPTIPDPPSSRWPYRLAWLLALVTFPLICVGGMVTTYGAGMAVPDWPNTYGYNLFLYPLESWLGVWDVLLEHSHRLFGASAGMATIALLAALWWLDRRRWMKWLGVAALAGVSLQGVLGGLRVIQNEALLADVHGCTAPVFFALTAALVVFTSPRWQESLAPVEHPAAAFLHRLALLTTASVYAQIVLGAQVRHLPLGAGPDWLAVWIYLHLIVAGLSLACVVRLLLLVLAEFRDHRLLVRRTWLLLALFAAQLTPGGLAWVTKYGWPAWFHDYVWPVEYTVEASGRLRGLVITAHVGAGSLVLVTALSMALWSLRLLRAAPAAAGAGEEEGGGPHLPERPATELRSVPGFAQMGTVPFFRLGAAKDYWQLARPRIVAMVLGSMAVAALVSDRAPPPWRLIVHALIGSALVIVGAITLNQRIEHQSDAKMLRTAQRPLPAGRLGDRQATLAGLLATVFGLGYLAALVNWTIVVLAVISWLIYVWVYTPLKLQSAWQTPVGALAGAMPVLMGAAVTHSPLSVTALALFGVLYFWQFPHAMAIAWLGRRDFAAANLKVATVVDASGRTAAWLALLGAILLLPISLVPWWLGPAGGTYAACAAALGLLYVAAAGRFLRSTGERSARTLLRASLVYLPALLIALAASLWR